jgi:hypothetical protein
VTSDTTSRTTTRPNVSVELDERLSQTTTPLVRVPADRLTFGDRLRVLLDEYDEKTDECDRLRDETEQLRERVGELQQQLEELNSGLMNR